MTEQHDPSRLARWAQNLDELDREIAKFARLCGVRILDPGVMERVLRHDKSVCGSDNPGAFEKLRGLLMMHLTIRQRSVAELGQTETMAIEDYVIERLRKSYPDLGNWPPA
jgi:hypothetical protein